ncbi:sensor histidine kinase [Sphaerisporangium aureirubrum]|uniref:histidine kinase n=1 Tax=Sphaerisporangium aureirubrum TaxID=1544736 RepID=A0ABW1NJW0_9ACTN
MPLPRLSAYAAAALVVANVAAGVTLLVLSPDRRSAILFGTFAVLGLVSAAIGVMVAVRRPDNIVATLLVLVGASGVWMTFGEVYTGVVARRPGLLPVSDLWVGFSPGNWMYLYALPALLMLYFPDGRLLGPRWRWIAGGLVVVPVIFIVVGAAVDPTPFAPPFDTVPHAFGLPPEPLLTILRAFLFALLPTLLGLLLASATSMFMRYRRATDPVHRAQLKWFALGAACLPATLLVGWAGVLLLDDSNLVGYGLAVSYLALPAATAVAMLRYDLYDVDRALSTTVTYGLVTAALLGFYTVASFVVGLGAGGSSPVAVAAATAVCAAALTPLRSWVQRRVDSRLYPARRAALSAIEDLQRRTHAGTARPEQLESALREALHDPQLRVGYRLPGQVGDAGLVDANGTALDPGNASSAPVRLGGHDIGAIVRGTVGSRELLREVAAAAVLLVEVVRLRIELNRALRDVESSRERLLHAGYAERRRLERDLHDGAQQRLVSLGMALRLAQRHLHDATLDVNGLLDQSVTELGTAIDELRQIAHGLRPSSLDDGLGPALMALTSGVPVTVTVDVRADLLPDQIATTAYYVASEALANAVKHAQPGVIGVSVLRIGGQVSVQVSDDGSGGARPRPGAGLAGLADRVAAAGGQLRLFSPEGGGTVVEAVLPCAS